MQCRDNYVKVWDIYVRLFHWGLVSSVLLANFFVDPRWLHRYFGYTVMGLVTFRLIWGLIGSRHAKFTDFIPSPRRAIGYMYDMLSGKEERYIGHNPAGALMIVALILTLGSITVTGHMMTMKTYFGQSWVEHTHEFFVNILYVLVICHLSGVIYSSLKHNENLVRSMISGVKRRDD